MSVAIVDYGSGNLHSAAKAFERASRESGAEAPIVVTGDPDAVRRADRVVLPGVGAFADCRRGLDAVAGMTPSANGRAARSSFPASILERSRISSISDSSVSPEVFTAFA